MVVAGVLEIYRKQDLAANGGNNPTIEAIFTPTMLPSRQCLLCLASYPFENTSKIYLTWVYFIYMFLKQVPFGVCDPYY